MEKRELTCIGCPMGCALTVSLEAGKVVSVEGYTCKRGRDYGEKECTNPMRTVTSSVPVTGGAIAMVSVKTASDIPKGKIQECMEAIHTATAQAPVHLGDVILTNIADTGVNLIATKAVGGKITGFTLLLHEKNGQKVLSGGKEKERDRFSF